MLRDPPDHLGAYHHLRIALRPKHHADRGVVPTSRHIDRPHPLFEQLHCLRDFFLFGFHLDLLLCDAAVELPDLLGQQADPLVEQFDLLGGRIDLPIDLGADDLLLFTFSPRAVNLGIHLFFLVFQLFIAVVQLSKPVLCSAVVQLLPLVRVYRQRQNKHQGKQGCEQTPAF